MNFATAFSDLIKRHWHLLKDRLPSPHLQLMQDAQAMRATSYSHYQFYYGTSLFTPPGLADARGQHK